MADYVHIFLYGRLKKSTISYLVDGVDIMSTGYAGSHDGAHHGIHACKSRENVVFKHTWEWSLLLPTAALPLQHE